MLTDVREYVDRLHIEGHTIGEDHDDDPLLIGPDGRTVDTWPENYPYEAGMAREEYDEAKYLLQVELFESRHGPRRRRPSTCCSSRGRDAVGKGAPSSGSWSTSIPGTSGPWR